MDLKQAVLAKLKASTSKKKTGGGRFSEAAKLAYKALEGDDYDGFEKAFDAAIRIRIAEKGADE